MKSTTKLGDTLRPRAFSPLSICSCRDRACSTSLGRWVGGRGGGNRMQNVSARSNAELTALFAKLCYHLSPSDFHDPGPTSCDKLGTVREARSNVANVLQARAGLLRSCNIQPRCTVQACFRHSC